MSQNSDDHTNLALAIHRIAIMEREIAELRKEQEDTKRWQRYYDRLSLKWGSFCFGALAFGAAMMMGFDKLKDKVVGWFFP